MPCLMWAQFPLLMSSVFIALAKRGTARAFSCMSAISSLASARHVIAVGDVHGRPLAVRALLEKIESEIGHEHFVASQLVFLGDFVGGCVASQSFVCV